jgi:hypothetical protein
MIIRLNRNNSVFTGGELIEIKDSRSYTIPSFNSIIPAGKKKIEEIIDSSSKKQLHNKGVNIDPLAERDVFYLVRGRRNENTKTCLVHGSFFETVKADDLIAQSFHEYLNEGSSTNRKLKLCLLELFENTKIRKPDINNASVKLRFIPEAKVKAEGNILNSKKYPEIKNNTLNLVLPCHDDDEKANLTRKMQLVFGSSMNSFDVFKIKHHFNGYFLVFQTSLNGGL